MFAAIVAKIKEPMRPQEIEPTNIERGLEKSLPPVLAAAIQRAVGDFHGQLDLAKQVGVVDVPNSKKVVIEVKRAVTQADLI